MSEPTGTTPELTDAELRSWASENGIEGVPVAGKLSAEWRERLLAAKLVSEIPVSEVAKIEGEPWLSPEESAQIASDLELAVKADVEDMGSSSLLDLDVAAGDVETGEEEEIEVETLPDVEPEGYVNPHAHNVSTHVSGQFYTTGF